MSDERDGWKLMPTKHDGRAGLTHEMFDAFWLAFITAREHHGSFESVNAGYNAMLAAAPKPPSNLTIVKVLPLRDRPPLIYDGDSA